MLALKTDEVFCKLTDEEIAQWIEDVDAEEAAEKAFLAAWKKVPRYANQVARSIGLDENQAAEIVAAQTDFALALEVISKACARFQACLETARPSEGGRLTHADLVVDNARGYALSNAVTELRSLCNDYHDVCDEAFWDACGDNPANSPAPQKPYRNLKLVG